MSRTFWSVEIQWLWKIFHKDEIEGPSVGLFRQKGQNRESYESVINVFL